MIESRVYIPRIMIYIGLILAVMTKIGFTDYSPTTFDRIPLTLQQELIWELTSTQLNNWADYSVLKYPSEIDVKNIAETNLSLTIIPDCGWSRIMSIQTAWNIEGALDNCNSYGHVGRGAGEFRFPVGVAIGNYNGIFDPLNDYIFIVDSFNKRIVKLRYDALSNALIWNDSFGSGELVNPRCIYYFDNLTASRSDDRIILTDVEASKLIMYDPNGAYDLLPKNWTI